MAAKQKQRKKGIGGVRMMLLLPVMILGFVLVFSNIFALMNLRQVNANATEITDEHMVSIEELDAIQTQAQNLHKMALSHIIAIDVDTMIVIVDNVRAEQKAMDESVTVYASHVSADSQADYQALQENYAAFKLAMAKVMAFSAANQNESAYACANTELATTGEAMLTAINNMKEVNMAAAEEGKVELTTAYGIAFGRSVLFAVIGIFVVIVTVAIVLGKVIRPIVRAEKELAVIIQSIDDRRGDLTKRITVKGNDEIAALGRGINVFMEKLQHILGVITDNSQKMEVVVGDVLGSVGTSTNSVADLSALTEELTATMQEMASNATLINANADSVREDANQIAEKTNEITEYSKNMKAHADDIESSARNSKETTDTKVTEMLTILNEAIKESESVKQVDSLTNEILSIASQTNLLALNASIEAARAGEAGRGFAVVADEISQLASASSNAANRIQTINAVVVHAVENLAGNANELVDYMKESIMPEFDNFVQAGSEYRDNAAYIEETMQEFSKRTDALNDSVSEIANSIETISNAIDEGANGISSVADSTQVLVDDMDTISSRMNENAQMASALKDETEVFANL